MRNFLLLTFVAVVTAVTYLNHYTMMSSTAYFREAQTRADRDLFYIKTTGDAQDTVKNVGYTARVFLSERDYAQKYAMFLNERCSSLSQIIGYQSQYIEQLEQSLTKNGLPLPLPPATDADVDTNRPTPGK